MARFKKFKAPKLSTIIGAGTDIQGDIHFIGGLHIDGNVKGNVTADNDGKSALTISDEGNIEGDVRVPNVILNGTVVGDVYASQRVELAPKARVTGTVYYSLLEMAMGSEVNGQLIHADENSPIMTGNADDSESQMSDDD